MYVCACSVSEWFWLYQNGAPAAALAALQDRRSISHRSDWRSRPSVGYLSRSKSFLVAVASLLSPPPPCPGPPAPPALPASASVA
eukprot:5858996-Pyramimonas_sp.AAC.1